MLSEASDQGQAGMDGSNMSRFVDMKNLLLVEEDERLANIRCPGTDILLWPMVRTPFLRLIMSDLIFDSPIPGAAKVRRKDQAIGLAEAAVSNVLARNRPARIMIRATAMGGDVQGGKHFHRLSDYFVERFPDITGSLEDLGGRRTPRNRYNQNVVYHDPILVISALRSRSNIARQYEAANSLVTLIEERSRQYIGWQMTSENREWYCALVARYIARAPYLLSSYKSLLRRAGTRLLLVEEGSYGNAMTCLISAARQLGITTAEIQHGLVSRGHDVYSLAASLSSSKAYRLMLPDYFLSYGDYWGSQLGIPVPSVSIGNPHTTAMRETLGKGSSGKNILILGDGIQSRAYIELAKRLAVGLRDRDIVLRPHPLERNYFREAFPQGIISIEGSAAEIRIDTEASIYTSLSQAREVLSEVSTGLFEAIGIAQRVLVWETPRSRFSLPDHPMETFRDAEDLIVKLSNPIDSSRLTAGMIWAPNWQTRYDAFVQEILAK